MAAAAGIVTKDYESTAKEFVAKASADQLNKIASGTTLGRDPLVTNLKGSAEEKTEGLRKLVTQRMRREADFRGMVIRLLSREGLVSAPAPKEAKKDAKAAAGKEGGEKEKKPKKEKGEGKEKGGDEKKGDKPGKPAAEG